MTAAPDDLVLTVINRGVISVSEKSYNLDQLVSLLRDAKRNYLNQGVRGDDRSPYQAWPTGSPLAMKPVSATCGSRF